MKTLKIALMGICFALLSSFAAMAETKNSLEIKEGIHYVVLDKPASSSKEVTEVFSFNCPACYTYEDQLKITDRINAILPEGASFNQLSLATFGRFGEELTNAWAAANTLGVEKAFKENIYAAIHKDKSLSSAKDIDAVFTKIGVSKEEFDAVKNSFLVKASVSRQQAEIKALGANSLPTFYVNGKYRVMTNSLPTSSNEAFAEGLVNIIQALLNL